MRAAAAAVAVLAACADGANLTLNVYGNMGFSWPPASTRNLNSTSFSIPADAPFSAEALGSLTLGADDYQFTCSFGNATMAFVWVDDHLVCQWGAYSPGKVTSVDNPLRKLSKATVPFRVELYNNQSSGYIVTASVSWSGDGAVLQAGLSAPEMKRRSLQRDLASGWAPWNHNSVLDQVQLPSGSLISTQLCELTGTTVGKCQGLARPDDGATRVGILAEDWSVGQFYLAWQSVNVSFRFSGGVDLSMLFDQVSETAGRQYAIVVTGRGAWMRVVDVSGGGDSITLSPHGLPAFTATAVNGSRPLPSNPGSARIVLPLGNGTQGISTSRSYNLEHVKQLIDKMESEEHDRYAVYGDLAQAKAASQAGVMWNVVYTPAEAGPVAPVSRGWSFTVGEVTSDFTYVIFDWDNIFASYLIGLDNKPIAYSNLIQVIRSKTSDGFVPNFAAGTRKSTDRTEPPIGAKVLLELWQKYFNSDKWLVELLFDDLLDWNNWFVRKRELLPLNLICLGGDGMQASRYESGLDNSPMYDGDFWNSTTGQMELYDVGMTSMFTMEAEALAVLADAVGRPEGDMLRARAAAMRKLLVEELWDAEAGIFVNKFPNGTFYRRVTPTSFYPLLTKGPSKEQAESMVTKWLMNRTRFCITPNGDFAGNSDDCYWGLPSISADDPAFPPLGYWRGYVWGPMMQLTYWGLQLYDDVPAVRSARKALCKQMTALMLSQWNRHGHICENYGPHKNTTDCTGNKYYHWGALAGLISVIEQRGGY